MNNDTINAAEEYANKLLLGPKASEHFIAGAEYMQAQKDEQIKELVEALEYAINIDKVSYHNLSVGTIDLFRQLIQKHKG